MTEGQHPVPAEADGTLGLHLDPLGLVVHRADQRVAISNELWNEILEADVAEAGYEGYPVVDADEATMTLGTPGRGVGQVTYKVTESVLGWILLEKVQ